MKNSQIKRFIAILLIAVISILLGVAVNEIWNRIERNSNPKNYEDIVTRYSREFDVPEYIIYATIKVESDFDPYAVSSAGAVGLMQIMPETFDWLKSEDHLDEKLPKIKLEDPEVNIKYGTYYLSYLYKKFDYNWDTAFAAYNAGEGNVRKWLSNSEYSDGHGNLKHIPFEETRNYVKKVNNAIEQYQKIYSTTAVVESYSNT